MGDLTMGVSIAISRMGAAIETVGAPVSLARAAIKSRRAAATRRRAATDEKTPGQARARAKKTEALAVAVVGPGFHKGTLDARVARSCVAYDRGATSVRSIGLGDRPAAPELLS